MSTIIAGRFKTQEQVQTAIAALTQAGFPQHRISSFYVNPQGQHDRYMLGGDHDKSVGAENTDKGAVVGGATGAAIGLAAAPVIGPLGPLVGAYVGSMMGGLAATKDKEETEGLTDDHPSEHLSGMVVAVALDSLDTSHQKKHAIELLRSVGGFDLEVAEGRIEQGDWVDFDPLKPPQLIRAET